MKRVPWTALCIFCSHLLSLSWSVISLCILLLAFSSLSLRIINEGRGKGPRGAPIILRPELSSEATKYERLSIHSGHATTCITTAQCTVQVAYLDFIKPCPCWFTYGRIEAHPLVHIIAIWRPSIKHAHVKRPKLFLFNAVSPTVPELRGRCHGHSIKDEYC